LSLLLAAAGCGSSSEAAASPDVDTQLAMLLPDFTSETWDRMRSAAVDAGQDQGVDVNADAADTSNDPSAQAARLNALAAQKYDCLAVAPVDTTRLIPSLVALTKKKVPILNVGMQLDPKAAQQAGVPIASFIGPSDKEIGYLAAGKMVSSVPAGSQVALLVGKANDPDGADQRAGFVAGVNGRLETYESKATGDDYLKAQQVVTDLLGTTPGLRGIFAGSDTIGLAALKAVRAAGKADKVKIITVGGGQAALKGVRDGQLVATVATYPVVVGSVLVRACQKLVAKNALQPRLTTPVRLVDSTDIADELRSFPQPAEGYQDPLS